MGSDAICMQERNGFRRRGKIEWKSPPPRGWLTSGKDKMIRPALIEVQTSMEIKSLPKVLYIEDMSDSRALVRRLLEGQCVVLESGDPISGIELARDTHPDLILLDINLPDMNGREAAARLKSIVPQSPF